MEITEESKFYWRVLLDWKMSLKFAFEFQVVDETQAMG